MDFAQREGLEKELCRQRDEAIALMEKNRDDANTFIAQLKAELEQERAWRKEAVIERDNANSRLFVAQCAVAKLRDTLSRLWVAVTEDADPDPLGVVRATTGVSQIPLSVIRGEGD
jgi:hypothetical protein